jgi:hypothetical protein
MTATSPDPGANSSTATIEQGETKKMLRRLAIVALVAFVAVAAVPVAPVHAADNLVPGKIIIVKPGKLQKFIAKPISPAVFPLPAGANSPLVKPWNVWFKWFSNWFHITLPSSAWKGLGNPPGDKGYKYKGAGTLSDPCKVVLVKEKIIKGVCKGPILTPDPPHPGVVLVQIGASDLSDRYCAEYGGTEIKNDSSLLKRKDAPAPALCGSPSGAFVDSASGSLF